MMKGAFNRLLQRRRQRGDDAYRFDLLKRIEQHGWTGVYVSDFENPPTWTYSIGFHSSLGAPEVVVFDLTMQVANNVMHEVYQDLASGGLVLRDGERWRPGDAEGPLVWKAVHPSRLADGDPEQPWLGLAEDFAKILAPEKGPISAFQLVLSDNEGHLPWEPGYDERLRHLQRALWEPVAAVN